MLDGYIAFGENNVSNTNTANKAIKNTTAFVRFLMGITCLPRANRADQVGGVAGVKHTLLRTIFYHNAGAWRNHLKRNITGQCVNNVTVHSMCKLLVRR